MCSAFDRGIWLTFDEACGLASTGDYSGVGIVLTGAPVSRAEDGAPLYLVGIDIDAKSKLLAGNAGGAKGLWLRLGKPYREVSPSGNGIRMFSLSTVALKNGNQCGNEMYIDKRFLTVTGNSGRGQIKEATEGLISVHREWFGTTAQSSPPARNLGLLGHLTVDVAPTETRDEIAKTRAMLAHISADCNYEIWRNIIWSIESTGWRCTEKLGREWSMTFPRRFNEPEFQATRRSFKPDGGIGFGTLVFKAKEGGWTALRSDSVAAQERFTLLSSNDLEALPPIEWLIRGVLPTRGIAAIYGASGSGKSFLVLDAIGAIAAGADWFGSKVRQVPVVYLALEGQAGTRQRVQAWEKGHGNRLGDNFRVILDQFALNSDADVDALAKRIGGASMTGGVIVIDTLNQAAPEADENSSQDMGRLVKNAKRLQEITGGVVLLIHHTGKDAGRGLRGHSSLAAALDAAIEVTKTTAGRQWTLTKSKDGVDGEGRGFRLDVVPLGVDRDGQPISSCIVAPVALPPAGTVKKLPQGGHQKSALTTIDRLLAASRQFGKSIAPAHAPCVPQDEAIAAIASNLVLSDSKRNRERAAAALQGLVNRRLLVCSEGWLWKTP